MSKNPTQTKIDRTTVSDAISVAIASIRATTVDEIRQAGPNALISEMEAMAAVSFVEQQLGCGPLLRPSDLSAKADSTEKNCTNSCLTPADPTSIKGLTNVVVKKLGV